MLFGKTCLETGLCICASAASCEKYCKQRDWIKALATESDTAIIQFLICENEYLRYQVAINIKAVAAVPLEASSGPEGSRKLRFVDYMTKAQDGGKVVSLRHRPPLPPRKYSWYSFLLEAESTPGP